MSAVYFNLGVMNLACAGENIQLTATTSLTFLCGDTSIQSYTQMQLARALRTAKAVAKRGPGCSIDVDVDCDGVTPPARSIEALKENLALAICKAPWWSQVPIRPVLQQLPDCFLDVNCPFSIALKDTLPDFLSEDNHNDTRSTQDVKIPSGVSVFQIQRIAITLKFRRLVDKTNSELREVHGDIMDMSFEGILGDPDLYDDPLLFDDQNYLEPQDTVDLGKPIWTSKPELSLSFGDEDGFLLEEDESIDTPSLPPDISPFNSQESALTHLIFPDDAREYDCYPKVALSWEMARLLTDVAMRTLIGGGQTMSTDRIQLLRPLPRHTLAALIPLLFSPDFSSTMSQRSRFLPTITSTVTSFGKTAQSPILKSKLAKLTSKGHTSGRATLPGTVQAQAYRIMHTSLFSAKSARNLLIEKNEESKDDDKNEESMIIDGSTVSLERRGGPRETPWEDISGMDFEDMLEDEPLSEDEIDMLLDLEIMRQSLVPTGSILLSNNDEERHLQDAESMIDMDMRFDQDEILETRDGSMMEISGKSYVAEDNELALPEGHLDMLF